MYICPNCNNTSQEATNFCPHCGTRMVQQQVNPQPVYQQPVYYSTESDLKSTGPSKGSVIVGMIFGIAGLAMAVIFFIYSLSMMSLAEESYYFYTDYMSTAIAYAFVMPGLFSLPASLVGMNLSRSNRNQGDTSAMSNVGKIMGIVGLIISCVTIFFGFIMITTL